MAGRLAGKIAIITGGGSGIGRACALRFAAEDAAVCVADINPEGAAETVRQIEAAGGRAVAVQTDTADEAATAAMVDRCVAAFGAVDLLVAAAGISGARPGQAQPDPFPLLNLPTEHFQRVLAVNLYGVLFSDRAVARWLVAHGRPGAIVNIASVAAKLPLPGGAYSISNLCLPQPSRPLPAPARLPLRQRPCAHPRLHPRRGRGWRRPRGRRR
jgi:NAD(P)-dependent dehydrogenase (short-subunit alcohol dehydrogenase family)